MIRLEYFNGEEWIKCGDFHNERIAWLSLGGDDFGYRTINTDNGDVLTNKYPVKVES